MFNRHSYYQLFMLIDPSNNYYNMSTLESLLVYDLFLCETLFYRSSYVG